MGSLGFKNYRATYSFDHRDRLVLKSWKNLYDNSEAQWQFYYDINDRLVEVKHTPLIASPSTYALYSIYWLSNRPVAIWSVSFPAGTTGRYYLHSDENARVIEMHDWPTAGDAVAVWAVNHDVFGWDRVVLESAYQPFRIAGLLNDDGTLAWKTDAGSVNFNRPELLVGRGEHWDTFTGLALQRRGEWPAEPYQRLTTCVAGSRAAPGDNPVDIHDAYLVGFIYPAGERCSPGQVPPIVHQMVDDAHAAYPPTAPQVEARGLQCTPVSTYLPTKVMCVTACNDDETLCFVTSDPLRPWGDLYAGYMFGPYELGTSTACHGPETHLIASQSCPCGSRTGCTGELGDPKEVIIEEGGLPQ